MKRGTPLIEEEQRWLRNTGNAGLGILGRRQPISGCEASLGDQPPSEAVALVSWLFLLFLLFFSLALLLLPHRASVSVLVSEAWRPLPCPGTSVLGTPGSLTQLMFF